MESYRRRNNLDYLIGQKVKHAVYGKGEVIQIIDDTLYIQFPGQPALLRFPMDSFVDDRFFERKEK